MYIGIDSGTQSTKAVLWDEGRVISQSQVSYALIQGPNGQREQDPSTWYDAMLESIERLFSDQPQLKSNVRAIGVGAQQHGLVLLDNQDNVIRPALLWCDTRPEAVLKEFEQQHGITWSQSLGIHVPVAFSIAKLLWIRRNDPQSFKRIHKIMLPHDFLNYRLTGRYTMEPGDASGTGWFHCQTRQFSDDIVTLLALPEDYQPPTLLDSHHIVDHLLPDIARQLGLPRHVTVSSGGGDNMMSAIGSGNVTENKLTVSLGTSGTVFSYQSQPLIPEHHADINAFCSSNNGYLPLVSTMNVTLAIKKVLTLLGQTFEQFESLLTKARIGCDGLVSFPMYYGSRLPNDPSLTGALFGMSSDNLNAQNLLRSTVESVTYNINMAINILQQTTKTPFTEMTLLGGGARSNAWRQLVADVSGLTVTILDNQESAAVGAAIQAYWSTQPRDSLGNICTRSLRVDERRTCRPNGTSHSQYQELFTQYQSRLSQYIQHNN